MSPLPALARFFAPDPVAAPNVDPIAEAKLRRRWQWSALLSITLGYGFFYTTRLSLSVAKKPLIDEGLLSATELGQIGSVMLLAYGIGRFTNGILADRVNLRRFFATGLLCSAIANVIVGLSSGFGAFLFFWTLNGWVQSMGAPTSGVILVHWWTREERGTVYSVWGLAHNIGEGLTFLFTALLVGAAGWRHGFIGPGILCAMVALILYRTNVDRPEGKGFPRSEHVHDPEHQDAKLSIGTLQREVLRNPYIWALGLASGLMYVVRYALNNWGILYLQIEKGYTLEEAGLSLSLFPIVGIVGTVLSGIVSDRVFGGRRAPVTTLYGLLLVLSLVGLCFVPPTEGWFVGLSISLCGFAIGGLLVFLGGLAALDLCSPRAAGCAMGFVGVLSYLGAAAQDWLSGGLLDASRSITASGSVTYDFTSVKALWFGASIASLLLASTLWLAERGRNAR